MKLVIIGVPLGVAVLIFLATFLRSKRTVSAQREYEAFRTNRRNFDNYLKNPLKTAHSQEDAKSLVDSIVGIVVYEIEASSGFGVTLRTDRAKELYLQYANAFSSPDAPVTLEQVLSALDKKSSTNGKR